MGVLNIETPFLTYFRCPKCNDLASIWRELAENINNSDVVMAKADCSAEPELCIGYN